MWQNGYGETRKAFRLRYLRFHKHAASKKVSIRDAKRARAKAVQA